MSAPAGVLPGGVGSNFRYHAQPVSLALVRGAGTYVFDADGNRYIDYILGNGPAILGHSPEAVLQAVQESMSLGQTFVVVILEPIACNAGVIEPRPDYLQTLRRPCDRHGIGAIFATVFTETPPIADYCDYKENDAILRLAFVEALQHRGIRTTARGTWFLSTALRDADIEETLASAKDALEAVAQERRSEAPGATASPPHCYSGLRNRRRLTREGRKPWRNCSSGGAFGSLRTGSARKRRKLLGGLPALRRPIPGNLCRGMALRDPGDQPHAVPRRRTPSLVDRLDEGL